MARKMTLREAAITMLQERGPMHSACNWKSIVIVYAITMLQERGPMHYRELTAAVLKAGLVESGSATPEGSLNAVIAVDIKRKGKQSPFIRTKPGVFGLRAVHESPIITSVDTEAVAGTGEMETTDQRVRVPLFPTYSELRQLLRIWPGRSRKQITGLKSTIGALRGTPQKTVDWTNPVEWIPERLSGGDRELAESIWRQSGGSVNPRHTYGRWRWIRPTSRPATWRGDELSARPRFGTESTTKEELGNGHDGRHDPQELLCSVKPTLPRGQLQPMLA